MGRDLGLIINGMKPAVVMVVVQIVFAGVNVFYKLASNDGMNLKILVAYRHLFATTSLVPLAFFVERNSRPNMTWMILFQAFLCGLFGGTLSQNLFVASLALTSATFASAMMNLVPAVTFIMAISLRLERLAIRTLEGKVKVMGTVLGICGAMLLTFYKGVEINLWSTNVDLLHHGGHTAASHRDSDNRVLGSLLALGACLSYSAWLIIQAKMNKNYPCPYSSTALMCIMGSIQTVVFALWTERDWNQWKLGWNIRLYTVAYTGVVASGLTVTLIAWCIRIRGPLFVSVFIPLMLVIVAFAGSLLLEEKLHLGSVLGSVLIVCGLYAVLWGKGKEMKRMTQLMPSKSSSKLQGIEVVVTSGSTTANKNSNTNSAISNVDGMAFCICSNPAMASTTDYQTSLEAHHTNSEAKEVHEEDKVISSLVVEHM